MPETQICGRCLRWANPSYRALPAGGSYHQGTSVRVQQSVSESRCHASCNGDLHTQRCRTQYAFRRGGGLAEMLGDVRQKAKGHLEKSYSRRQILPRSRALLLRRLTLMLNILSTTDCNCLNSTDRPKRNLWLQLRDFGHVCAYASSGRPSEAFGHTISMRLPASCHGYCSVISSGLSSVQRLSYRWPSLLSTQSSLRKLWPDGLRII